ncbi:MAG: hypothetical protein ACFE9T_10970 [Promethearchaeota archaeon]
MAQIIIKKLEQITFKIVILTKNAIELIFYDYFGHRGVVRQLLKGYQQLEVTRERKEGVGEGELNCLYSE